MLQVVMSGDLKKKADDMHYTRMTMEPHRGTIFDRQGRPLTTDLGDYVALGVDPKRVLRPNDLAADLARIVGKTPQYYLARFRPDKDYIVLARKVPPELADKLEQRGWQLNRQPETERVYPHHELAAQVLGFCNVDNQGISGIELACEPLLKGEPGWRMVQRDVNGVKHLDDNLASKAAVDGKDIALTLDLATQSVVEEELRAALKESDAQSVSGLVVDPRTGEILAIASLPSFDPNQPEKAATEAQKVRPLTDVFEPGSVFKVFGASYLLEKGLARPSTRVDCSAGAIQVHNKLIRDSHNHGILSFADVVAYSSNVGMIKLTGNISPDDLYNEVKDFGFLAKTGVELKGEVSGLLPKPANWSGTTQANLVIGQGIAVSMLQVAMAYSALANDGRLMQPHLIKGHYASEGTLVEVPPQEVRQVVSKSTARTITSFMTDVVEKGTATRAKIEGMTIAGKTGTAQKINPDTKGYYDDRFFSSFVGYFPAEDPRFLVMVTLDDPKGAMHQGGQVAAPVFQKIAQRVIGLNPELWQRGRRAKGVQKAVDYVAVPDIRFRSPDQAGATLEKLGFQIRAHGEGDVVCDQSPAPGARGAKGDFVELTLGPAPRRGGGQIVVPYLSGLSLREAVAKVSKLGFNVRLSGSGRVVQQLPVSGARAAVGDMITIVAAS